MVLGEGGIESFIRSGMLLIDHTTGSPALVREIGEKLGARGAALVDAPISGGVEGARSVYWHRCALRVPAPPRRRRE